MASYFWWMLGFWSGFSLAAFIVIRSANNQLRSLVRDLKTYAATVYWLEEKIEHLQRRAPYR